MTDYDDLAWNRQPGPWPRPLEGPVRNPDDIPRPAPPEKAGSSIAASIGCVIIVLALCGTAIAMTAIIVGVRP